MKAKAALLALLLLTCLFAISRAPEIVAAARAHAPSPAQLPRDFAGGRPGQFRFHPQEQLQADRLELVELRIGVERLRSQLSAVKDAAARDELRAQLERWQVHLDRMEARITTSAGPTAQEVEGRLNSMKGARACGVCHGQGYSADMVPTGR